MGAKSSYWKALAQIGTLFIIWFNIICIELVYFWLLNKKFNLWWIWNNKERSCIDNKNDDILHSFELYGRIQYRSSLNIYNNFKISIKHERNICGIKRWGYTLCKLAFLWNDVAKWQWCCFRIGRVFWRAY